MPCTGFHHPHTACSGTCSSTLHHNKQQQHAQTQAGTMAVKSSEPAAGRGCAPKEWWASRQAVDTCITGNGSSYCNQALLTRRDCSASGACSLQCAVGPTQDQQTLVEVQYRESTTAHQVPAACPLCYRTHSQAPYNGCAMFTGQHNDLLQGRSVVCLDQAICVKDKRDVQAHQQ